MNNFYLQFIAYKHLFVFEKAIPEFHWKSILPLVSALQ